MSEFGWAVIGTGRIANTVMREITMTGRHKVVSVYSRTRARAEEYAAKFGGAKVAESLAEAVNVPGVMGVYIATPHSAHYKQALECISLGKPCLIEKAFTINAAQAEAVFAAAKAKGVYVSEAMWARFNPITKKVRELVASGAIGKPEYLKANFCLDLRLLKRHMTDRVYKAEYGGGALLDLGVYPVSYAEMLFGYPDRIESAVKLHPEYKTDFDDKIKLIYNSGAVCELDCSLEYMSLTRARINGSDGYFCFPFRFYRPKKAYLYRKGSRKETLRCPAGYIHQFDKVAADITAGKLMSEEMPWSGTVNVMKIMDAVRYNNGFRFPDKTEEV